MWVTPFTLIALSHVHVLTQQVYNSEHVALNLVCYIYSALFHHFTRALYHVCLHFYRMFIKIWLRFCFALLKIPYVISKGLPQQGEVDQGVPGRLRPRIFFTFRHYKGGRSSVKRTGHLYYRRNPWYSISEAESTSGHMFLSGEPRKKSPVTPPGIYPVPSD